MEKHSQEYYDKMLASLIPNLSRYKSKCGNEAEVFFVDNNFVVKKYTNFNDPKNIFEKYFEENRRFNFNGFCTNDFYAFKSFVTDEYGFKKDYYILEERVKDKSFYYLNEDDFIENLFSSICSVEDYKKAIDFGRQSPLYEKIAEINFAEVLRQLEYFESISIDAIESYFWSVYQILLNSNYNIPDVHLRNMFFDKKKITLIDNIIDNNDFKGKKNESSEFVFNNTFVNVFFDGIYQLMIDFKNFYSFNNASKLSAINEKSKKVFKNLLKKYIRAFKNVIELKLSDENRHEILIYLNQILGKEETLKINKELEN